jgi:hypothetical protein
MDTLKDAFEEYPITAVVYPEVIALRWRNGVLEQGRKEVHTGLYDIAVRQDIRWEPVPMVPGDEA